MLLVNYKLTNPTKGIANVLKDVSEANKGTGYIERLNAMEAAGDILYRSYLIENDACIFTSVWISKEVNYRWTAEMKADPLLSQFDANLIAAGYIIDVEKIEIQ